MNVGSPTGREPYGDRVPVVVAGVTSCQSGDRESRTTGPRGTGDGRQGTVRYAECRTPEGYLLPSVSAAGKPCRDHGISHWRAQCIERCPLGSEEGCAEKARNSGTSPRSPSCWCSNAYSTAAACR